METRRLRVNGILVNVKYYQTYGDVGDMPEIVSVDIDSNQDILSALGLDFVDEMYQKLWEDLKRAGE